MRSKHSTLLTEIIIALLFFSLSSIIMVQLFAAGYEKSLDSKLSSQALYCAQDWAEQAIAAPLSPPDFFKSNGWVETEDGVLSYQHGDTLTLEYTFQLSQGNGGGVLYTGSLSLQAPRDDAPLLTLPLTQYRREGDL